LGFGGAVNSLTGSNTFLHNLTTKSRKGSSIALVPKSFVSNAGVSKIPDMLLRTTLHRAVGTEPPLVDVSRMHMLIVVGKHERITNPSSRDLGKSCGINVSIILVVVNPMAGQTAKVTNCMIAFLHQSELE